MADTDPKDKETKQLTSGEEGSRNLLDKVKETGGEIFLIEQQI